MDIKLNPYQEKQFASCSLDYTIKMWSFDNTKSLYTLQGHDAGVNCIAFSGNEEQYLISGGDDFLVILWDLTTKNILKKFEQHKENVTDVIFFKQIDFFVSTSEDGIVNFYGL